jgi:hypothetical protein
VSRRDHRAEHLRQPGAKVAAGDLREIADVEPGAGNNRAVGTAAVSSFLNSDAPLAGSGRRGGQRPRNGLPVQATRACTFPSGTCTLFSSTCAIARAMSESSRGPSASLTFNSLATALTL